MADNTDAGVLENRKPERKPDVKVKFNYAHTVNRTGYRKDDTGYVRPHVADRLEKRGIAKRV